MEPVFVGIDPGQSGGIAVICGLDVRVVKMPETERDLLDYLCGCHDLSDGDITAVLEKVSSSPQMGVSSAFKFGIGVGQLRMALTAAKIPFDEVLPQKWQKVMGCRTGGDKNISKRRAQALFPGVKVTHAFADALLIASYCRRARSTDVQIDPQSEPLPEKSPKRFDRKRKTAGLF